MGTVSGLIDGGASIAGLAAKSSGASTAAQVRQQQMQYQASVADQNAIIDQDRATITQNNEQTSQQSEDLQAAQVFGAQRANLGANGIDLGSGSANELLTSTELTQAIDDARLQQNALYQAWGYTNAANQQTNNANYLRASAATISPSLAGAQSLLSAAPQVSNAWLNLAKSIGGLGNSGSGNSGSGNSGSTDSSGSSSDSSDSVDTSSNVWGP